MSLVDKTVNTQKINIDFTFMPGGEERHFHYAICPFHNDAKQDAKQV